MLLSFIAFMLLFAAIGLWSIRHSKGSTEDYLLAGRQVPAWLTGLSAVATNNSGQMFIGLIGYTYAQGLSSLWLAAGWLFGDYIASRLMYERLRAVAGRRRIMSFAGLISRWHGVDFRFVRAFAGLLTIAFLATYAAAQLKAGSKALHVLLGWDYSAGAIIGACVVLAYCFAGGLRASIWTDAAQSIVMFIAMAMIFILAVSGAGGFGLFTEQLTHVRPDYMNWFPENDMLGPVIGPLLFVLGWVIGGFGVAGQPHVVVRFMAIDGQGSVNRARFYYYAWSIGFYALTIGAGLAARLYVTNESAFDMELALPLMAQQLLPGIGVGIVLAGLFAATISTADSQILSCTAAVTQDFTPARASSLLFTKFITLLVTGAALSIALFGGQSVFTLVLLAWSSLASAFVPILAVHMMGGEPSERLTFSIMATGLLTAVVWSKFGLGDLIFEAAPGMLAGFAVYALAKILPRRLILQRP